MKSKLRLFKLSWIKKWFIPPFVYCKKCKDCEYRRKEWWNLFDTDFLIDCCDINGISIKPIIKNLLSVVICCKLYQRKE